MSLKVEVVRTWTCDRCGIVRETRHPSGFGAHDNRPDGWSLVNGADVCPACDDAFATWWGRGESPKEPPL